MLEVLAISLLLMGKEEKVLDPAGDKAAPANAVYFADCFKRAAEQSGMKEQNNYLVVVCQGDAAKRFYDKLGTLPEKATFAETRGTASLRYTSKPKKNTDGLDACWQDTAAAGTPAEYSCRLIYPAGPFLTAE